MTSSFQEEGGGGEIVSQESLCSETMWESHWGEGWCSSWENDPEVEQWSRKIPHIFLKAQSQEAAVFSADGATTSFQL